MTARTTLSLRVDAEVVERLRRLVSWLVREHPTFRVSTSDAARLALLEGLKLMERRAKRQQD